MGRARCLCGTVTWEIEGPFELMHHCHCSRCRKAHGVPFATYVVGPAASFRLRGGEHMVRWESSPGVLPLQGRGEGLGDSETGCFARHCPSPGMPVRWMRRAFSPSS